MLLRACLNTLSDGGILSSYDANLKTRILLKPIEKIKIADIAQAFRAKKYRGLLKGLDQPVGDSSLIGDDVYVLDTVRLRSAIEKENRSVTDWTLEDILSVDK